MAPKSEDTNTREVQHIGMNNSRELNYEIYRHARFELNVSANGHQTNIIGEPVKVFTV